MLRYEAWASLAAVAGLVVMDSLPIRRSRPPETDPRRWLAIVVPVGLILAWAALRRPVDGRWFGFLGQTQEFANDALRTQGSSKALDLVRDALYYPVFEPVRVMGAVAALVPFGIVRTVRQQGARFVLVLAACLGFVTLSWMKRAMLGLDRHFVCIVPLYATFAAQGAAVIADGAASVVGRATTSRAAALWGRMAGGLLACAALAALLVQLDVWMGFWRDSIARGWPERAAAAAYLRTLPDPAIVFCDDATIEIPSGLDRRRFDRHWMDDPHTWDLVAQAAREHGVAYVATWRRKLRGHEHAGDVVFRAGYGPGEEDSSGVAVMRVRPDEDHARR
jgi:hypothetical protein